MSFCTIEEQYETDSRAESGDDYSMSRQAIVELNPLINERLWQAWIVKNRELDRQFAVKRRRVIVVVLAMLAAGVTLHRYLG
jgi:hypothetical protein